MHLPGSRLQKKGEWATQLSLCPISQDRSKKNRVWDGVLDSGKRSANELTGLDFSRFHFLLLLSLTVFKAAGPKGTISY